MSAVVRVCHCTAWRVSFPSSDFTVQPDGRSTTVSMSLHDCLFSNAAHVCFGGLWQAFYVLTGTSVRSQTCFDQTV